MPINKETIISVYDDKLTLMQWLKTINKALEDAVLTGVEITKKGNATLSFKFTFEDGTFLESNDLVLQQGESVNNAYIQNGHLYLTLTNGNILDAGNVKPVSNFSIDANQHLIVNYGDGTSQDLGAIFSGNVNISGTLNATKVTGDEIVENMSGYSFTKGTDTEKSILTFVYAGVSKTGNKLTLALAVNINKVDGESNTLLGEFVVPSSVYAKLYPALMGGNYYLAVNKVYALDANFAFHEMGYFVSKSGSNVISIRALTTSPLGTGVNNYVRIELTFLLSDNLAQ